MKLQRLIIRKKAWTAISLAAVLCALAVLPVRADTQSDIADARARQSAAEESLSAANDRISTLTGEKAELQTYLTTLNEELGELSEELTSLDQQIADKNLEIEMAKAAIVRAQNDEANQYADMQLRIKYMYENSTTSFMEALCEASDISDFLNRADEISQIQEYDRQLLDDYKTACATVKKKEADLEVEEQALEALKAEAVAKQTELKELASSTDSKIAEYTAHISEEELQATSLKQQIADQKALIVELEAKAAAEEEARRKAEEEARRAAELAAKKAAEEEAARKAAEEALAEEAAAEEARSNGAAAPSSPADDAVQTAAETPSAPPSTRFLGHFMVTAYCPCAKCCGRAGASTASGVKPTVGHTVAMGGVPFGTKLMINGVIYTVEDRGTPYGHVDIFMGSHGECLQFGLRYMDVYIVE